MSCGQTCLAPDYVLVMAGVYDEFVQAVQRNTVEMYTNTPQTTADYTRIISKPHFK